jgi:hypothetical protein
MLMKRKTPGSSSRREVSPVARSGKVSYVLPSEKSRPATALQDYAICIMGEAGVGKSALSAEFPNALFAAFEARLKHLTVYKVPTDKPSLQSWGEWLGYLDAICKDKEFDNIVLDTADSMYRLCSEYVCKLRGWEHKSDAPPGKAYDMIDNEMYRTLRAIQAAGKGVIFITHAAYRDIQRSDGQTYSRLETSLSGRAAQFVVNAVDMLAYFGYSGNERRLWLRGDSFMLAKCTFQENFLTTAGKEVKSIPMGKSAKEGYDNLLKAFHNQQTEEGGVIEKAALPDKRKPIDMKGGR